MTTAIYPGTFDPITFGHLDILKRSLDLFDRVIVAVSNSGHKSPLFLYEKRIEMVKLCLAEFDKDVVALGFTGLLVDFAKEQGALWVIRGVRNTMDYVYEAQLAGMNAALNGDIQTLFLPSKPNFTQMSSSLVRDIARLGGDISAFVPIPVANEIKRLYTHSA